MKKYLFIFFFTATLFSQSNQRSEILSETPLYPVPENMTFEEYQDMNRRMSIGVGLAFIPIPGIVHRYAGEKELAKRLSYVSIGGFISLVGSVLGNEEKKEWGASDYEILIINQGLDNETRFEKIPTEIIGDDSIKYKLNQVYKKVTHSGGSPVL